MLSPATINVSYPAQRRLLWLVAAFELVKGLFVMLIGLSAILLVHKDAWVIAESLLALLHISTDRHWAQLFLDFADNLTDARLWMAAQLAFSYTALRFAEAYGLWKERTWAEWLALVSGTLLLPLEIRGLMRGITMIRSSLFVASLMIVFYMLYVLRVGRRHRAALRSSKAETRDSSGE
jgi:uncharacterized membrane protein (DUF2068 family)